MVWSLSAYKYNNKIAKSIIYIKSCCRKYEKKWKKSNSRQTIVKYPELLPYILLKHKNIKNIAIFLKQIIKQKLTVPILPKEKKLQPLNLTFVNNNGIQIPC